MRILFVTANRVGDAVLSTGILAFGGQTSDRRDYYCCGPAAISLFRALPNLHRLIVMEKTLRAHWLSLWRDRYKSPGYHCRLEALRIGLLPMAGQRFIIPKAKREMHRVELLHPRLVWTRPACRRSGLRIRQKMERQAAKRSPSRQQQIGSVMVYRAVCGTRRVYRPKRTLCECPNRYLRC